MVRGITVCCEFLKSVSGSVSASRMRIPQGGARIFEMGHAFGQAIMKSRSYRC